MKKVVDALTVNISKTKEELGAAAARDVANAITNLLKKQEEVNIVFASAPSQSDFFEAILTHDEIDWTKINVFHMDEYVGLGLEHDKSLSSYLRNTFLNRITTKQNYFLDGTKDPLEEIGRYEALIAEHPIDIVCMGIGENGHIAFNEPHVADFDDPKAIKIIDLDETNINQQVSDGAFPDIESVPRNGITLTIPTLTSGKYTFCIVPAINKAEAVQRTLQGEVTTDTPASILRTVKNASLYLDEASASLV